MAKTKTDSRYWVREATEQDAYELAPKLRDEDVAEIWAANRATPLDALLLGVRSKYGKAWTGLDGNEVKLMFGVTANSAFTSIGVPWFLSAPLTPSQDVALARRSIYYVEMMRADFPMLENYTDARHKAAIRWLRWCGFTVEPAEPYGVDKLPFHRFWIKGYVRSGSNPSGNGRP
jgi:hypothetical protein